MHLAQDENILKTFYHHPLPLLLRICGIWIVSFPFFFVSSFFQGLLNRDQMLLVYGGILIAFFLITIYTIALYFLDRVVVTNKRILHIDWKGLFLNCETEADLSDIQDIEIQEPGLLASFKLFNFGTFRVETASATASIIFKNASEPESIKNFIYHLQIKPSKIVDTKISQGKYDYSNSKTAKKINIANH